MAISRRRWCGAMLGGAVVTACSLAFPENLSGGPDAPDGSSDGLVASEATTPPNVSPATPPDDASADADATVFDNDADAGPGYTELFTNNGFEGPAPQCGNPWVPDDSTLVLDAAGRSGAQACKVCGDGANKAFSADLIPGVKQFGAGIYHIEAWFKPIGTTPIASFFIGGFVANSDTSHQDFSGLEKIPSSDWVFAKVTVIVVGDQYLGRVYLAANGDTATACFLVDDATMWKE